MIHGLTETTAPWSSSSSSVSTGDGEDRIAEGERVRLAGEIENPLVPGRYMLNCWIRHDGDGGNWAVQALRLLEFDVYGTLVALRARVAVRRLRRDERQPESGVSTAAAGATWSPRPDPPGPSGPSAAGGWRRSCELLRLLAVTDFKKTYFGTALGYLWSLARPLMLFGVLLAVFTQIFRIGSEVPNYPVLLLFNIVLFGFFQEATITAVQSLVSQESVVRKTQFPRLVIPLAVVLATALQPRAEPRRRVRLHPRVGHRPDLDAGCSSRSCCSCS